MPPSDRDFFVQSANWWVTFPEIALYLRNKSKAIEIKSTENEENNYPCSRSGDDDRLLQQQ
jgi:hypothetical protein